MVRSASTSRRRGVTVVEAVAAFAMLSVAAVSLAQLMALSAQQARQAEQRRLAGQELANWMERVAATPWEELTNERLAKLQPAKERLTRLTDAQATVRVEDLADEPASRRIELAIAWPIAQGTGTSEVRLAAWRYPPQEQTP